MRAMRVREVTRRGSVAVEFALVLPLLVGLFLGVIFFGYDFYTYNRLEEVVRAGARFASNQEYNVLEGHDPILMCGSGARECNVPLTRDASQLAHRTQDFVVYGDPAGGTELLVEGLTADKVSVSVDIKNNRPVRTLVAITGYPMRTPAGTITLTGKPAAVFPWVGNYVGN